MNAQLSVPKPALADFCEASGVWQFSAQRYGQISAPGAISTYWSSLRQVAHPACWAWPAWRSSCRPCSAARKVDLRTPEDLSRYFRQEVLDTAEVQYAQG